MKKLFLTEPHMKYKESFKEYALSYKAINDGYHFNKYKRALDNFEDYINDLKIATTKITRKYEVVTSTFWLVNENEVVGVVRLRHEEIDTAGHIGYDISPKFRGKGFGTEILKLALIEAKKIGLSEVILTCNVDNDFSRKVIEKNNGKFIESIYDEEGDELLDKFRIDL